MSILIKGMEMPTGCYDCTLESICGRWAKHDAEWQKTNRDEDCPLVPVPPHGRLIDADALLKPKNLHIDVAEGEWYVKEKDIVSAPTIIESEVEG